MGSNALRHGADLLPALRKAGSTVSQSEIIELLSGHWRPRVMGAWFALMHDDDDVAATVVRALATSLGYLDSQPLVTAGRDVARC